MPPQVKNCCLRSACLLEKGRDFVLLPVGGLVGDFARCAFGSNIRFMTCSSGRGRCAAVPGGRVGSTLARGTRVSAASRRRSAAPRQNRCAACSRRSCAAGTWAIDELRGRVQAVEAMTLRCRSIASTSSSKPCRHRAGRRAPERAIGVSRRSGASMSMLLEVADRAIGVAPVALADTTWMSAISRMPALIAWTSSPRPGARPRRSCARRWRSRPRPGRRRPSR